jgi:hypothetical protein
LRDLLNEEFWDLYWAGPLPFYYEISYSQHVGNIDGGQPRRKNVVVSRKKEKDKLSKT